MSEILVRKPRDYAKERKAAIEASVDRTVALREDRDTGALGDEVIKMAQALILCTLPYRPTAERQVVRSARLSDGSTLRVTFTAGINGIDMAFGNDRHLMAWLFDKAINSDTAFVTIKSASDYLRETGKSRNGDRVKELAARLSRLTGLVIGIERRGAGSTQTVMLPMIASSNLPSNLTVQLRAENSGQRSIPGMENPFGIQLEERFFQDIKNITLPSREGCGCNSKGKKAGPSSLICSRFSSIDATARKAKQLYRGRGCANNSRKMTAIRDVSRSVLRRRSFS